jgi:predicted dehydrogenase
MKFLIAGLGSIGNRHLQNLLTLDQKDIVLYRTFKSTLPSENNDRFPVETNLSAALSHNPDAVIISNPTSLHLDVAIPAANMGCHIFMEKPLSNSLDRVDELKKAVENGGGHFYTAFQFRFHPGLRKIKFFLDEGKIGRPVSVRSHWGEHLPGWHPWEDYRLCYSARNDLGGGVVLTLCHPLDYLRWLFGDVSSVQAFTAKLSDLELDVEDTAEIGLQFSSGVLGSVHLDFCQKPPAHYLEIIGTEGTIRWNNADGTVHLYPASRGEWQEFSTPGGFSRNNMFLEEMGHFISVIQGNEMPACTLDDGIGALRISLAALNSQKERKKVRL